MTLESAPHRRRSLGRRLLGGCLGCLGLLALGGLVVAVTVVWLAEARDESLTLRLTGSPEVAYVGSYTVYRRDGRASRVEIEGGLPAEYRVDGIQLYAHLQRQPSGRGVLRAQILVRGAVVDDAQTIEPDGVLDLAARTE